MGRPGRTELPARELLPNRGLAKRARAEPPAPDTPQQLLGKLVAALEEVNQDVRKQLGAIKVSQLGARSKKRA